MALLGVMPIGGCGDSGDTGGGTGDTGVGGGSSDGTSGGGTADGDDATIPADDSAAAPDDDAAAGGDDDAGPAADAAGTDPVETGLAGDSALDLIEIGWVTVDPTTGQSDLLAINAPDDIVSFTITVTGAPAINYAVHNLTAPDGTDYVYGNWYQNPGNPAGPQMCANCVNRVSSSQAAMAAIVPIAPSVAVLPGSYTFQVIAWEQGSTGGMFGQPTFTPTGGDVWVEVWVKRASAGLPDDGVLDLNLFFTGGDTITAESAQTNQTIQDALVLFEGIYESIGVSIGTITYTDIDPAFQVVEGIFGEGNDFEVVAALTEDAPPGVNLIFCRELVDNSSPLSAFGVILGVSGGIPGPVGTQGTGRSAVIVDTSVPAAAGSAPVGFTMAHEVGHYLGLFHSSEIPFAGLHDPIADTANNDTSNLMFYEATGQGTTLTFDQGRVVRGNPWVRHITTPRSR